MKNLCFIEVFDYLNVYQEIDWD